MDRLQASTRIITGHTVPVHFTRFSYDGDILVTGDNMGVIFVVDSATGNTLVKITGPQIVIKSLDLTRDGRVIAAYTIEEDIIFYSSMDGHVISKITHDDYCSGSVNFNEAGDKILIAVDPRGSGPAGSPCKFVTIFEMQAKDGDWSNPTISREKVSVPVPKGIQLTNMLYAADTENEAILAFNDGLLVNVYLDEIIDEPELKAPFPMIRSEETDVLKVQEGATLYQIQYTVDKTGIMASIGSKAFLLDSTTLKVINQYNMDTYTRSSILLPTSGKSSTKTSDNYAAFSKPVVVCVGGLDPKHAATRDTNIDEFRIQFFDAIAPNSKMLGKLDGHRGTIHCIDCTRDGRFMASGCEDSGVLLISLEAK